MSPSLENFVKKRNEENDWKKQRYRTCYRKSWRDNNLAFSAFQIILGPNLLWDDAKFSIAMLQVLHWLSSDHDTFSTNSIWIVWQVRHAKTCLECARTTRSIGR